MEKDKKTIGFFRIKEGQEKIILMDFVVKSFERVKESLEAVCQTLYFRGFQEVRIVINKGHLLEEILKELGFNESEKD